MTERDGKKEEMRWIKRDIERERERKKFREERVGHRGTERKGKKEGMRQIERDIQRERERNSEK